MSDAASEGFGTRSTSKYILWAVFAVPGIYLIGCGLVGAKVPYVGWSGIVASWFLAAAMLVTPLQLLFGPLPWLRTRRRYIGVASFAYTLLHMAFWVVHLDLMRFLRSFIRPDLTVGWLAFAIMVPLAATSLDSAVRKMGRKWKSLQRWVYAGAALVFLHWVMTTDNLVLPLVSAAPVVVLSAWRVIRYRQRLAR